MTTAIESWVESDGGGVVYAGEHLRLMLHIKSNCPGILLSIVSIQLKGELSYRKEFIDSEALRRSRPADRRSSFGGGTLFAQLTQKPADDSLTLVGSTPTIIPCEEVLEEDVDYSCIHPLAHGTMAVLL